MVSRCLHWSYDASSSVYDDTSISNGISLCNQISEGVCDPKANIMQFAGSSNTCHRLRDREILKNHGNKQISSNQARE